MKDIYETILDMLESGRSREDILVQFKNSDEAQEILELVAGLRMRMDEIKPDTAILHNAITASKNATVTHTAQDRYVEVVGKDFLSQAKLASFINFITYPLMHKRLAFVGSGIVAFVAIIAVGAYMVFGSPFGIVPGANQDLAMQLDQHDISSDLQDLDAFLEIDVDIEGDLLLLAMLDTPADIENIDEADLGSDLDSLISDLEELESFGEPIDPELEEIIS